MNNVSRLLLPVLAAALLGSVHAAEATLKEHSVKWEGSMPAKAHEGLIPVKSLQAAVNKSGKLTELRIILDMENLSVTDLKKEKDRKKLEGHLKSGDFFLVKDHPSATFELKEHKADILAGTLTIRGIAKAVEIPATLKKNEKGDWELTADFTFNRQDFDVNYQNSGFFGTAKDKLIRDNVDVAVKLVFSL